MTIRRDQRKQFFSILHQLIGIQKAPLPNISQRSFALYFVNDGLCLDYIFQTKIVDTKGYYRTWRYPGYVNRRTGKHIYPLVGTALQKTTTPLTDWFYAIYMIVTRDRVTVKEMQRQLRVTYKTAWRMRSIIKKARDTRPSEADKKHFPLWCDISQIPPTTSLSPILGISAVGERVAETSRLAKKMHRSSQAQKPLSVWQVRGRWGGSPRAARDCRIETENMRLGDP
jgi:hypothetical protein